MIRLASLVIETTDTYSTIARTSSNVSYKLIVNETIIIDLASFLRFLPLTSLQVVSS